MCGIAGRVNFRSGAPVDADAVRRMCALIAHRGPDGEGVIVDGPVGLGHRRLAIIDLTEGGRQPMAALEGRVWVTFNGEIYNYQELRRQLAGRGHAFHTDSDTEVLLAAYLEYGVSMLDHLRGMFAFAVWDARADTLFIARDRLGKKPLHYRLDVDGIAFASEPKAFLAEESFVPEPDAEAISHYLTYQYVPAPHSAFRGVRKLPPAHYLLIRDGRVMVERFWSLRYLPKQRIDEQEAADELLARLTDSVRLRMISDVPIGAFLSGGIDSGVVVALMAGLSSRPVRTFSIGFEEQEYDERAYAREIARRYGTDHQEFVVRPDSAAIFDRLAWHYNEPYADESALPTFILSEMTRRHVTVALNGDAGDENFAGYRRYDPDSLVELYARLPLRSRRAIAHRARAAVRSGPALGLGRVMRWLQRGAEGRGDRYVRRMTYVDRELKQSLYTPEFAAASGGGDSENILLEALAAGGEQDFLDAMMQADVATYLPDCLLVKVDIASMAHGLEARSPMLDHTFMEFVARLPANLKMRRGIKKYILKTAAGHLLPPAVLTRPKMGFGVPLEYWFRGSLRDLIRETLLSPAASDRGYFEANVVRQWIEEHEKGIGPRHDQLWTLLMLELWHRAFIDRRPVAAPASLASWTGAAATRPW